MTMKRIYITIDTEMDSDPHWIKHYPPAYTSVIKGIPRILRPIWDKYDAHPIYFVSPEVLYDKRCVAVLRREIQKGAVVGAHLHPEYIDPDSTWGAGMEKILARFPCSAYSDAVEREKLKKLTELIEQKLGVRPEWYRAARFGADTATIRILRELGYRYDSSVTPKIDWRSKGGPDHSAARLSRYRIAERNIYDKAAGPEDDSGIYEFPVTIFGKRFGILGKFLPENWLFYRWLRPSHMTSFELKRVICEMERTGLREGVMMFHSMEIMVNRTPYVRTRWMQRYYLWKLEKTLAYAKAKGYEL